MAQSEQVHIVRASRIWVGPGRPCLDDGALAVRGARVAAVGPFGTIRRDHPWPVRDMGPVLLAPGLVNCHCHLELSHLRGRVAGGGGYADWVRSLLSRPRRDPGDGPMRAAAREMAESGTVFAADVTGRHPGRSARALAAAGLGFWICVEFIGHALSGPPGGSGDGDPPGSRDRGWPCDLDAAPMDRVAAGGHALYSTSPEALVAARRWSAARGRPFSLHLAESADEEDVLARGGGALAAMLARRLLPPGWEPPRMRPVAHADALGLLGPGTLAVHGVRVRPDEARLLAERGAAVCLCPRSNEHIGVGRAPWADYRRAGTLLCVGTDSLASNADLDLWNEARFLIDAGAAGPDEVLSWLTAGGARALGVEKDHGTLEPGRIAGYTVVPEDLAALLRD